MVQVDIITVKLDENYYTNPDFGDGLEEVSRTELIKENGGMIRFSIADAMNVYRALVATADKDGRNRALGGRLG